MSQKNTSGFQKFLYFGIATSGVWTCIRRWTDRKLWSNMSQDDRTSHILLSLYQSSSACPINIYWVTATACQAMDITANKMDRIHTYVHLLPQAQALSLSLSFLLQVKELLSFICFHLFCKIMSARFHLFRAYPGRKSSFLLCKARVLGTYRYCGL